MGEAITKPRLPMAFLGQNVLIKDGKYVGWENLMASNVMRLYLTTFSINWEASVVFVDGG